MSTSSGWSSALAHAVAGLDAPDGSIVMIEKWTSAELLDAHGAGQPVADLNVANDGLLASPVEVTRLVPIPVGDAVKGAL